ncbi:hypothetical protein [Streptomyces sp. TLI_235]|nr:hypothetical protein [Streptomyces sp. TLI_235]PBC69797.1 hypothetical protein BX265_7150 [Streptomyces sp. TLI_235]
MLSRLAGSPAAQCVLYGAGAFGAVVPFFDRLIAAPGTDREESSP